MAHDLTDRHGRPAPRTQKKTPENCHAFISHLADSGNVAEAARRIGISRWLAYDWKRKSTDGTALVMINMDADSQLPFHEAWDAALEEAADDIEAEVHRRAVKGFEEPVVHQGEQCFVRDPETGELERDENGRPVPLTVRKYSDRMLEILIKARKPERFRENYKVTHAGEGGFGVLVVPSLPASEDDWEAGAIEQQTEAEQLKAEKRRALTAPQKPAVDAEYVELKQGESE